MGAIKKRQDTVKAMGSSQNGQWSLTCVRSPSMQKNRADDLALVCC
jgi:hypothetical protein